MRELVRADAQHGAIQAVFIYCTGDLDGDHRAKHAASVKLICPEVVPSGPTFAGRDQALSKVPLNLELPSSLVRADSAICSAITGDSSDDLHSESLFHQVVPDGSSANIMRKRS